MTNDQADIGGGIRIILHVQNGQVERVECISSRHVDAAQVFVGKPAGDITQSIGSVFSLCGKAQTIAALTAIEDALDIKVGSQVAGARDLLRLSEMLTQTAMRLCLNWPSAFGLPPEPELVKTCLLAEKELETCVMGGSDWKTPGAGLPEPDLSVAWILDNLVSLIVSALGDNGLAQKLRTELSVNSLQGFGALPADVFPEQGALSRNWSSESVIKARVGYGVGLAARLEASLTDLGHLPDQMRSKLRHLTSAPATKGQSRSGTGKAKVETARGTLTHKVEIRDNIVVSYETEAPTEENFQPGGPVTQGLIGANATDLPALTQAARLHILAIDPCVDFHVEVQHA